MFFSIIIPVYKDLERLILLIDSIAIQNYNFYNFEVIIVNNDCCPIRLDVNKYFFSVKIVQECTPGSYAARNRGVTYSIGEVLAFIDSDCIPEDNWLETAFKWFENDHKKEIGILTGPVNLFFKNPQTLSDTEIYEKYTAFTTKSYAEQGHAITANWFVYKSVFIEFGGFDSNLKSNGDSVLSARINKKFPIIYSPDLIVYHPSRFRTFEIVNKYKRILGGTYIRMYNKGNIYFLLYIIKFIFRRYRFSLKKFFTVSLHESWAIFKVCNMINLGAALEYVTLTLGKEPKR